MLYTIHAAFIKFKIHTKVLLHVKVLLKSALIDYDLPCLLMLFISCQFSFALYYLYLLNLFLSQHLY